MPVDKGRLKAEDDLRIQLNYNDLVNDLEAEELTATLYQQQVITWDDKDDILTKPTRRGKVEELLKKVQFSGPNESYNKFVKALQKNYGDLARQLQETDFRQVAVYMPYDWVREAPEAMMNTRVNNADASRIAFCIGQGWEHLIQRLELNSMALEREKMSNPHVGTSVIVTNLLIKWTQKTSNAATWCAILNILCELQDDSASTIDWERLKRIVIK